MSPEQARGHEIDQRSDIFSVGAVFYFMLTRRKPFAASGLTEVLAKVQSEDPLPLREAEAPAPLAGLVMKALAKNPANRYQTCGQMAALLERLKRDLEMEAGQRVDEIDDRLRALEALVIQQRTLTAALGITPGSCELEASRLCTVEQRNLLAEPFRRTVPRRAWSPRLSRSRSAGRDDVDKWKRALRAVEEGARAAATGRTRDAIAQFELALTTEPAATRASAEVDRCRRMMAEQREVDARAETLLAEARRAAAAKQWQAALALCSDALALESRTEEAAALKRKALEAIEAETRGRRTECERALARAEGHLRKKRFQEATFELARARGFDPGRRSCAPSSNASLQPLSPQSARSSWHTRPLRRLRPPARRLLAANGSGRSQICRSFHARTPDASVAAEIGRLEAEAQRIAKAEPRAAQAAADSAAADAALTAGDPQQALHLATRALAVAPEDALARRVSGLAGAELKQQARARTRAAAAARHIEEAEQQLARGKFQKARALVSKAANLNPADGRHKLVLARIQEAETRVAAEAERERLANQRAKAVAPIIARARAAEAQRDFVRAAWTAENALAMDPECAEASEIHRRACEQIEAQPALADKTVDLTGGPGGSGDPDDTVSLTRPTGAWGRITAALRNWRQRQRDARSGGRAAAESKRVNAPVRSE